jgi:hypothetical protein
MHMPAPAWAVYGMLVVWYGAALVLNGTFRSALVQDLGARGVTIRVKIKVQAPHAIDATQFPSPHLLDGVRSRDSPVEFHTGEGGDGVDGAHGDGALSA